MLTSLLASIVMMTNSYQSTTDPMVDSLIAERLYYAEGRQHPGHPLHGSHQGLWTGSER